MKLRPITLRDETLALVRAGTCSVLWREIKPRGQHSNKSHLDGMAAGDMLWLREPFHMMAKFDQLAPTAAARFDARPIFPGTVAAATHAHELGALRPARTLPKAWHRSHLVVTSAQELPVRGITNEEIVAQGFPSRVHFQMAWDRQVATWGGRSWSQDPQALRFAFTFVDEPALAELTRDAQPVPEPA